jgi:hypothetical protein
MTDLSSPVKRKQTSIRLTQTPLLAALQSDNPSEHLFPYLHKKPGSSYTSSANLASPTNKLRHSQQRSISEFISCETSQSAYRQEGFFQTEVNIKPKTAKIEEIRYAYYSTSRLPLEKKPYDRKVGPGYYALPNSKSTPSFSFPITGRFESDKLEKMNCKY